MSYKAKSIAYFVCFLIASIAYYNSDNEGSSLDQNNDGLVKMETDQTMAADAFQTFKIK